MPWVKEPGSTVCRVQPSCGSDVGTSTGGPGGPGSAGKPRGEQSWGRGHSKSRGSQFIDGNSIICINTHI